MLSLIFKLNVLLDSPYALLCFFLADLCVQVCLEEKTPLVTPLGVRLLGVWDSVYSPQCQLRLVLTKN